MLRGRPLCTSVNEFYILTMSRKLDLEVDTGQDQYQELGELILVGITTLIYPFQYIIDNWPYITSNVAMLVELKFS